MPDKKKELLTKQFVIIYIQCDKNLQKIYNAKANSKDHVSYPKNYRQLHFERVQKDNLVICTLKKIVH